MERIAIEQGFENIEVINDEDGGNEMVHIQIAPEKKIKNIYSPQELEDFKSKYQYAVVEIDKAYQKKVTGVVIHSKNCCCGNCPERKKPSKKRKRDYTKCISSESE